MRTVVIGAGLAGLASALRLRQAGHDVTIITKGIGGIQLSQGTIDVFGYDPELVTEPLKSVAASDGPYATIGVEATKAGLEFIQQLMPGFFAGDANSNVLLPTAVGALRPTCLYPTSMAAGVAKDGAKVVIVGPQELKDFYPSFIAGNLNRTQLVRDYQARSASFSMPAREGEADSSAVNYARRLDSDPDYRRAFASAVAALVHDGETVGLPAILGLEAATWEEIQRLIGHPIFEIPLPPPGVVGMRINQALTQKARDLRISIMLGAEVTGYESRGNAIKALKVHVAGRTQVIEVDQVIYAGGGFESGSLEVDSYGVCSERIFSLPLVGTDIPDLIHGSYYDDQPLFRVGVAVDEQMRVLDAQNNPVWVNLYAVGGLLAGAARWREKNGEGIALGSAMIAGGK